MIKNIRKFLNRRVVRYGFWSFVSTFLLNVIYIVTSTRDVGMLTFFLSPFYTLVFVVITFPVWIKLAIFSSLVIVFIKEKKGKFVVKIKLGFLTFLASGMFWILLLILVVALMYLIGGLCDFNVNLPFCSGEEFGL